jgi:hypothetical protein
MLFNVFLANVPADRLKRLPDLLRPIRHGLVEAGHQVIAYGLGLLPAPAVNLLVEYFPDDAFVTRLLAMKAEAGERLSFGLLCADDVAELASGERQRLENLRRVAGVADFVWTVLPQVAEIEALCAPRGLAVLEFGFSERLVNRKLIAAPGLRDLDVVIDGQETPRRRAVLDGLTRHGLKCFISGARVLPAFATADLARRAKVFLDVRRTDEGRFASPARMAKGLHNGALVVSEKAPDGAAEALDQFAVACDPASLVDRCVATVKSGMAVDLGLAALAEFRAKTSMRANVARAMALPAFERLGRA